MVNIPPVSSNLGNDDSREEADPHFPLLVLLQVLQPRRVRSIPVQTGSARRRTMKTSASTAWTPFYKVRQLQPRSLTNFRVA